MKTLITSAKLPRLVTATIFGSFALGCSALSIAADRSDVPQAVVKFGDLNLATRQGAATLYNRIVAAAYEVCKSFDTDIRYLSWHVQLDACVHQAIADAVTKVGQPELFAVYNARNRLPLANTVAAR
jgi:UrcA family protein